MAERSPTEFDCGQQPCRPRSSHARHAQQIVEPDAGQPGDTTRDVKHLLCDGQRVASGGTGSEEHSHEFVVSKSANPGARQLLAGPIMRRHRSHSLASNAGNTSPAGPRNTAVTAALIGVSSTLISTTRACRLALAGSAATG
jgi:hypothetical protein